MTKRKIIFVPGKNPKPEPNLHHELLLRCLLHGLSHQDAKVAESVQAQQAFDLCAWNYTFYKEYDDISDQISWIDCLLKKSSPDQHDKDAAGLLKTRLTRLIYQLGDAFPFLIGWLADERVKSMLEGSDHYFCNHKGLADKVRKIVKSAILESSEKEEKLLIIAHSMGSVICYDALYELFKEQAEMPKVDLFLTIGSPLGLRYTQKRLLSYEPAIKESFPNNIRQWKNLSACGDLVSIDKTIADDFNPMVKFGLINSIEDYTESVINWYKNDDGYNQHRSYGYLVNPQLSKIITHWWRSYD